MDFDCEDNVKWKPLPLDLPQLKRIFAKQQSAVKNAGWASLFTGNHDQPRVVSRWGDDSTEGSRVRSAKALGLMLHMHRGTPYVYQGEARFSQSWLLYSLLGSEVMVVMVLSFKSISSSSRFW